jgi:hypothetical protein
MSDLLSALHRLQDDAAPKLGGDLDAAGKNISGVASFTADSIISPASMSIYIAASNALQRLKDIADYVCDGVHDEVEIQAAIDYAHAHGKQKVLLSGGLFTVGKPADAVDVTFTADVTDGSAECTLTNVTFSQGSMDDVAVGQLYRMSGGSRSTGQSVEDDDNAYVVTIKAITPDFKIYFDTSSKNYGAAYGGTPVTFTRIIGSIVLKDEVFLQGASVMGASSVIKLMDDANCTLIIAEPASTKVSYGMRFFGLDGNKSHQGDHVSTNFHGMCNGIILNRFVFDAYLEAVSVVSCKGDGIIVDYTWGMQIYGGGWAEYNVGCGMIFSGGSDGVLRDYKIADNETATGWDPTGDYNPDTGATIANTLAALKLRYSTNNVLAPSILKSTNGYCCYFFADCFYNTLQAGVIWVTSTALGGVRLRGYGNAVLNSYFYGYNVGINLDGFHHVITNNRFNYSSSWTKPISVAQYAAGPWTIEGNANCWIADDYRSLNNVPANTRTMSVKNTSGSTIAAYTVVKRNTIDGTVAPATASTDMAFGVFTGGGGTFSNNSAKDIITEGYCQTVLFDGAGTIAAGDEVAPSTTAGKTKKAASGDWVFAIAHTANISGYIALRVLAQGYYKP